MRRTSISPTFSQFRGRLPAPSSGRGYVWALDCVSGQFSGAAPTMPSQRPPGTEADPRCRPKPAPPAPAKPIGAERQAESPWRRSEPICAAERSQSRRRAKPILVPPRRRRANPGVQEGRAFVREHPPRGPGPAPSEPIPGAERSQSPGAERSQSPAPEPGPRRRANPGVQGRCGPVRGVRTRVTLSVELPRNSRVLSLFGPAPFSDSGTGSANRAAPLQSGRQVRKT